jgi:hypothetical protein
VERELKEELYAVNIKGEQRGLLTIHDRFYRIGEEIGSITAETTVVKSMVMSKNLINIYFEDGTRMVTMYDPAKVDLFYRLIKEKTEL